MSDVFARITEAEPDLLESIAQVLEMRAVLPQQRAMLESYLSEAAFPKGARVLEIGCGTGPVSRTLAGWNGVGQVVGVDPSPVWIAKARELAAGKPNLSFQEADGKDLPFEDASFDAVVMHTLLTHVPGPEGVLDEASRVLPSGGILAICDCDFSTITVATGDFDPLQVCADAFVDNFVTDSWIIRRLSALVRAAGFDPGPFRSHGFVETLEPALAPVWVRRGADALVSNGRIGKELGEALKAEADRRSAQGEFFGAINFGSLISRKR